MGVEADADAERSRGAAVHEGPNFGGKVSRQTLTNSCDFAHVCRHVGGGSEGNNANNDFNIVVYFVSGNLQYLEIRGTCGRRESEG